MANKSSTIALNIQANTQKALNQFKSFSSSLQNKFLISGFQLDVVRNTLSSINREFERYAGGGGLSDAIQTQQLTRSLQTSLSLVQGYSAQVGNAISENIGLALAKVNQQVGGSREDIATFTNDISTAINKQVALGLTGTDSLVAANEQLYSLMQKLKLGYGESIQNMAPKFQKVLLGQMSMEELLGSVSGGTQNLLRQAAFASGGTASNLSGVNRGLFFKKVQELSDKYLPSTEELIKNNPEAIIGKLLNFLFDDRIGVFGTLRKIKLPTGETTTILQEGAKLLNALFGKDGFLIQFTTTIAQGLGRQFGFGDGPDAPAQGIIALIRWLTNTAKEFTEALKQGGITGFIDKILDFLDKLIDSLPVDRLAETLGKVLEKFSEILLKVLNKVPASTGKLIDKTIQIIFKSVWDTITGQRSSGDGGPGGSGGPGGTQNQPGGGGGGNFFGKLLMGLLPIGAIGAGVGITSFLANRSDKEEIASITQRLEESKSKLDLDKANRAIEQSKLGILKNELEDLRDSQAAQADITAKKKEIRDLDSQIQKNKNLENEAAKSNLQLENEIKAIKAEAAAREKRNRRLQIAGGILSTVALQGISSATSGESLQRTLTKMAFIGGATGLTALLTGGAGTGFALAASTMLADQFANKVGVKYNGNFPTAANGLFGAMNKESLMSGNKGLVIANQDEIIAPPHRMAQLAGMVSNMTGGGAPQYALNEKFKKYQEDQKKQMTELIREIKMGNTIKRDQAVAAAPAAPVTQNTYNNSIDAKDIKEAAPAGWWDSLRNGIQSFWEKTISYLNPNRQAASGLIPSNFLAMYKSEMNAYGGRPVLANDKELIVSPRNYSTLASLMRNMGGGSKPSMNNNITINVSSNGDVDTDKIANAVMKAIDTKYREVYESLSYV